MKCIVESNQSNIDQAVYYCVMTFDTTTWLIILAFIIVLMILLINVK